MITAENITDEQVRELLRHVGRTPGVGASDVVFADCNTALRAPMGSLRRWSARARCADVLNALNEEKR